MPAEPKQHRKIFFDNTEPESGISEFLSQNGEIEVTVAAAGLTAEKLNDLALEFDEITDVRNLIPFGDYNKLWAAFETGGKSILVTLRGDEWLERGIPGSTYWFGWADEMGDYSGRTRTKGFIQAPVVDDNCDHFRPQRQSGPPMATAKSVFSYNPEEPLDPEDDEWRFGNPPLARQELLSIFSSGSPQSPSGFPHYNELSVPMFNAMGLTATYDEISSSAGIDAFSNLLHNATSSSVELAINAERLTLNENEETPEWANIDISYSAESRSLIDRNGNNRSLDFRDTTGFEYFGIPQGWQLSDAQRRNLDNLGRIRFGQQPPTCTNLADTLRQNLAAAATQRHINSAIHSNFSEERFAQFFIDGIQSYQAEVLFYEVERTNYGNTYRPGNPLGETGRMTPRFGGYPLFYSNSHAKTEFKFCDRFAPYGRPSVYNVYAHTLVNNYEYTATVIESERVQEILGISTTPHPADAAERQKVYLITYSDPQSVLLRLPYIHTILES